MGRVRGLGAAHTGTQDFWHQRVTSVAAIPLTIAAIIIVIALLGRSHAAVVQILGSPLVAIIMLLFIINTVYHMWIGLQEIIVDYVHEDKLKLACLLANTFFSFAIGFASAFAILKLSFGV
jgi:succinate dehydrogenase / fumarate reductase membrane anchor subunit